MKLEKSSKANINYLAKVVNIEKFTEHPNPVVTKLKCCYIDGYNVTVGIDSKEGTYIYFPSGCCINPLLLSYANLYRDKLKNRNIEQSGFFDDNGRVKSIKLQEHVSEGFLLDEVIFINWILSVTNKEIKLEDNTEFDIVKDGKKEFWINRKYIPKNSQTPGSGKANKEGKQHKGLNKLIENQFRFHYDTVILRKCPNVISPNDIISITEKVHGISGISAYVLCKQQLNWKQKIAKWLTGEEFNKYDYLYSSRSVVKNKFYNKEVTGGFYGVDVWKYADDIIRPKLTKGLTVYYEIVGFLPSGAYIQKNYDYGYKLTSTTNDYKCCQNFGIRVYRITYTNVDGQVHEYSAKEVQQWSFSHNLIPVNEYYYGYAKDLYPDLDVHNHWSENFLEKLANDKNFFMELNSPTCNNEVPHEGIVIKIEDSRSAAFKLKCFRFLDKEGKELDKGIENIEDNA